MSFVHLHTHTVYSLLDGFSNVKKLVKRAKEMEMPALAITDHGTMYGAIEFYNAAKETGIKPIIGMETYMAARGMSDRDAKLDKKSSHLLLLAENETGYRNLLKIASAAQLEGFYYYPRIDHDFLARHSEGLICTSGCMAAEIPRALLDENPDEAVRRMNWYYDVFGPDRFFVELQQHNISELVDLNRKLVEMGARYSARFVATNDVHYIEPDDAKYQDVLLAIQTGALLSDANRMKMTDPSYYLRSPQEMSALFAEVPTAISNTVEIAERCAVNLDFNGYHLPEFPVPPGHTPPSYLRQLCEQGMELRYGARKDDPAYRERLDFELSVIHDMGFDAYFLIVWDLCRHAKENNIWYNTRGSAAGSIVAYTLFITLVDPIEHQLLFERFLNPGRISMPDIDLDFRDDRRSEMLEYCAAKYGDDKVAQIITFGTMAARGSLRDVARVMDVPLADVDRVAKLVPNVPGKPVTLEQALKDVPELKQIYDSSPTMREVIATAIHMEGVVRNAGTHAAGVVIADRPLIEYLPLHRPTSGAEETPIKTVTQFEMGILENMGMLKVDFLGLSTLSVMARACELIQQRTGRVYDLTNIPLDDPATFELLGRGQTAGVFQLEGTGMTRWVVEMKPRNLDNIIAMVALYRPGPMDFIPSYIKRMHGSEAIEYRHPALEPIFRDTFGIPVYQEQIMRAAVELAGYSRSESDDLRKAIAKKQVDKLIKHREKFVKGAVNSGIPEETAGGIFADWEEFARYGFNKCLPGDVEVLDAASGRLVRIEDLYRGAAGLERVLAAEVETLTLRPRPVACVMDNGIKPVYRLTTASGRRIEATANHPFYTPDGWKILDHLQPGEAIAVPARLGVEGRAPLLEHEVTGLAAQLTGAGTADPNAASLQQMPGEVFTLPNDQVALLLGRIWDALGSFDPEGPCAVCALPSERLARQAQHLLLRLGIAARLAGRPEPVQPGCWQLQVSGQAALQCFADSVGRSLASDGQRRALAALLERQPVFALQAQGGAQQLAQPVQAEGQGADLCWDEIADIDYVGRKRTYDLEVPGDHNFVANDILVHNSHAADYGLIAVQTAYLKAHYPAEYMSALMTVFRNDTDKVSLYVNESRALGIEVLPPDVNRSSFDFTIEDRPGEGDRPSAAIRFGLGAVKNVGQGPVDIIIAARSAGAFRDISDFTHRTDLRSAGKRAVESLIKAGALDSFGERAALLGALDQMMAASASHFRAAEAGQMSLFGGASGVVSDSVRLPDIKTDRKDLLNWERELLGLYISDHPLAPYADLLTRAVSHNAITLNDCQQNEIVHVAGMVTAARPFKTKTDKMMGFATLEDMQGNVELVLFPRAWEKFHGMMEAGKVVIVDGKADVAALPAKVLVDDVRTDLKVYEAAPRPVAAAPAAAPTPVRRAAMPAQDKEEKPERRPAVAEVPVDYLPPPGDGLEDMPPPPEFPPDWETYAAPNRQYAFAVPEPPEPIFPVVPEPSGGTMQPVEAAPAQPPTFNEKYAPLLSPNVLAAPDRDDGRPPRMMTINLRPSGQPERDRRRTKHVYGILTSYAGKDHFSFQIFEGGKGYLLDFPSETTHICADMLERLKALLGEEAWRIEDITYL